MKQKWILALAAVMLFSPLAMPTLQAQADDDERPAARQRGGDRGPDARQGRGGREDRPQRGREGRGPVTVENSVVQESGQLTEAELSLLRDMLRNFERMQARRQQAGRGDSAQDGPRAALTPEERQAIRERVQERRQRQRQQDDDDE